MCVRAFVHFPVSECMCVRLGVLGVCVCIYVSTRVLLCENVIAFECIYKDVCIYKFVFVSCVFMCHACTVYVCVCMHLIIRELLCVRVCMRLC
jgi:hypothetical protein